MTKERTNEILADAKPCPFCGSTKLYISSKSNGHTCVYCRSCLTYGPRVLEYALREDSSWNSPIHWFKNLKDKKNNSKGNSYRPFYEHHDDSEVPYEWYYIEAVKKWNDRIPPQN